MADLLPSSPDPAAGEDGAPRVIGVDSDDADDLLAALYDDPATPSALAEEVDTSIQNVRYHLEKLTDAELVEVADTVYSEKGREMNVYAPAAKPLVVFAGSDDETPGLEAALSRLLGGLGVLGLSSLLVQRFASEGSLVPNVAFGSSGDAGGGDAGSGDAGGAGSDGAVGSEGVAETTASQGAATTASDAADEDVGASTNASEDVATDAPGVNSEGSDDADATDLEAETVTETTTEWDDVGIFNDGTETAEQTTVEEAAEPTTEAAAEPTTVEEAAETTRTVADSGGDAATDLAETTRAVTESAEPTTVDAAGEAAATLPPGLLFFAGGVVVLAALGVAWYLGER